MSECAPTWLFAVVAICFAAILWFHGRLSYRYGIWDGAFNQFLPVVKQEMERYRPGSTTLEKSHDR